ncbi:hypothetical protein ACTXJ5_04525 [Psychrobacter alimentarius]|uniref:hypothetical protein n=1 Tax=Psychrobacter alimentarius TaxID=261164 RepID=UPI003FD0DA92
MQNYTKKVIITCVVFALLYIIASLFHDKGFDAGVAAIAILWLVAAIYIFIINFIEFKKNNSVVLSILNILLTGFVLVLFYSQANQEFGGLYSFLPLPSFALLPSIISIFAKKPDSSNLN